MQCPECGSREKKEANFCSECGSNMQRIIGLELYHTNDLSVAPFLRKNTLAASPLRGHMAKSLEERLLDVTREGPITGWTERIAQLASSTGLPIEMVRWNGSPYSVASSVVQIARSWNIQSLETAISEAESLQAQPQEDDLRSNA